MQDLQIILQINTDYKIQISAVNIDSAYLFVYSQYKMEPGDKLVTIYQAMGQPEAEIIRGRLEVEGILAIFKYESLGSVYGLTVDGLGQVKVQVPAKYAERALEIISIEAGETEADGY